ncbi:hypothetical protein D3C74_448140 [compost metagenome]
MIPAEQCFHADNFLGFELYLRLIDQIELVTFKRTAQVIFQFQPFLRFHLHCGYVPPDLHSLVFGIMNGGIRILNQLLCRVPVSRVNAHAQTE